MRRRSRWTMGRRPCRGSRDWPRSRDGMRKGDPVGRPNAWWSMVGLEELLGVFFLWFGDPVATFLEDAGHAILVQFVAERA